MNTYHETGLSQTLKHVVEAIHHVVHVEVTVVDRHYKRLAGTGLYAAQIGHKVGIQSAFAKAMKTRRSYIIDQPGQHPVCMDCGEKGQCCETAEVCCPILLDGQAVGAIGLIAFDEVQKDSLLSQRDYLVPFLENMANLIAAKMKELSQAKELEILTDAVDSPLFSIEADGRILRQNAAALALSKQNQAESFQAIFGDETLQRICMGDFQFQARALTSGQTFEIKVRSIEDSDQYVTVLKPVKEVIGYVNRYFSHGAMTQFEDIWGEDPQLIKAKQFARQAAESTSSVLILGESGTGKELFARAIHNASPRQSQVFLAINCAAIPESLLESELFGYEEGAFTGALKGGRIGRFEQAHKGTLFLDEIGDLPLHLQAKLLRVLQEGRIQKLGSQKDLPVDVRIICATNQDLEQMVAEGSFRRDLFYRINVIPLEICPLSQRLSDLPMLAERFLEKNANRLGKPIKQIGPETLVRLMSYHWPGNVRELENVIEYMVNMCQGTVLQISDLPPKLTQKPQAQPVKLPQSASEQIPALEGLTLEEAERQLIQSALKRHGKTKQGIEACCKALGISRATLYRKLKQDKGHYEI